LDSKKEPTKIQTKQDNLIHHTVAEWMIFANAAVAEKIYSVYPSSAILRRHPRPKQEKFSALLKAASARGYTIHYENNNVLSNSLGMMIFVDDTKVIRKGSGP
jgi:exoribonuclease R